MAEILDFKNVFELFSLKGTYFLAYAFVFGMSVWVTFFGGFIAFKALPRQMFGTLQHKTFPIYFNIIIAICTFLLGTWTLSHPVLDNLTSPLHADVAQAYLLTTVILFQGTNAGVIGPMTSRLMFKRQKLEKEEGKPYTDPSASPKMKAMTKQFGALHGISSLLNLLVVFALGFHGLWVAHHGVGELNLDLERFTRK